jgi:excisionase family DNA binding protein
VAPRKKTEWLSVADLCGELGVTRSTIEKWKRKSQLPLYRKLPNGRLLFDSEDVAEWLDSLLVSA